MGYGKISILNATSCKVSYVMPMSASLLHHFLRSELVIELSPDSVPHLRRGCTLPTNWTLSLPVSL